MNRDTVRAVLAAAALMTVQVLLLAVLAASAAHAGTVYRCGTDSSTSYQAQPCPDGNGTAVRTADARSAEQRAQAQGNHERQMAWLDQQQVTAKSTPRTSSKRRHKQRRAQSSSSQAAGPVAVPLTSHRIGERPFERLGQQVTPPDRRAHKRKRTPYEITARTPKAAQPNQQAKGSLKPAS